MILRRVIPRAHPVVEPQGCQFCIHIPVRKKPRLGVRDIGIVRRAVGQRGGDVAIPARGPHAVDQIAHGHGPFPSVVLQRVGVVDPLQLRPEAGGRQRPGVAIAVGALAREVVVANEANRFVILARGLLYRAGVEPHIFLRIGIEQFAVVLPLLHALNDGVVVKVPIYPAHRGKRQIGELIEAVRGQEEITFVRLKERADQVARTVFVGIVVVKEHLE